MSFPRSARFVPYERKAVVATPSPLAPPVPLLKPQLAVLQAARAAKTAVEGIKLLSVPTPRPTRFTPPPRPSVMPAPSTARPALSLDRSVRPVVPAKPSVQAVPLPKVPVPSCRLVKQTKPSSDTVSKIISKKPTKSAISTAASTPASSGKLVSVRPPKNLVPIPQEEVVLNNRTIRQLPVNAASVVNSLAVSVESAKVQAPPCSGPAAEAPHRLAAVVQDRERLAAVVESRKRLAAVPKSHQRLAAGPEAPQRLAAGVEGRERLAAGPEAPRPLPGDLVIADVPANMLLSMRREIHRWLPNQPNARTDALVDVLRLMRDTPHFSPSSAPFGTPPGLVNLCNTCFVNSSIQALFSSQKIMQLISTLAAVEEYSAEHAFMAAVAAMHLRRDLPVSIFLSYLMPEMQTGLHCSAGEFMSAHILRQLVIENLVVCVSISTMGRDDKPRKGDMKLADLVYDELAFNGDRDTSSAVGLVVDVNVFYQSQINRHSVEFGHILDVGGNTFVLQAVIYWKGNVTTEGHYWCVRRRGDQWWRINDNEVTEVGSCTEDIFTRRGIVTGLVYDRL